MSGRCSLHSLEAPCKCKVGDQDDDDCNDGDDVFEGGDYLYVVSFVWQS